MKKENKSKIQISLSVVSLFILLFIISGQTQCAGLGGGGSTASKSGLDFYLDNNPDFLYDGKAIYQGETFNVGVIIENYDTISRSGKICIKDDISDSFLGISSNGDGDCQSFSVKAAEESEQKSQNLFGGSAKQITPGQTEIYFPSTSQYKYLGLPNVNYYQGRLFVSLMYRQVSRATATLVLPGTSQPVLEQEAAPLKLSMSQSTHKVENNYQTDLLITLVKQSGAKIFSPDFLKENVTYFSAEVTPQQLYCYKKNGEQITNSLELGSENIIKCSFLISSTQRTKLSICINIRLRSKDIKTIRFSNKNITLILDYLR